MNDAKFYDDIIRKPYFFKIYLVQYNRNFLGNFAGNILGNFAGNILGNTDKEMQIMKLGQISPTRISPVISSARMIIPNNDSLVDEPFSIIMIV